MTVLFEVLGLEEGKHLLIFTLFISNHINSTAALTNKYRFIGITVNKLKNNRAMAKRICLFWRIYLVLLASIPSDV